MIILTCTNIRKCKYCDIQRNSTSNNEHARENTNIIKKKIKYTIDTNCSLLFGFFNFLQRLRLVYIICAEYRTFRAKGFEMGKKRFVYEVVSSQQVGQGIHIISMHRIIALK